MNTKTALFRLHLVLGLLFIFGSSAVHAQNTHVKITGIKSAKGQIVLNIFKDSETYGKEQPYKKLLFAKKGLVNGTLSLDLTLEPGTYGITLLDDENENGEMDKNIIKMPKEGFGFSNFFLEKNKRPVFDDFKTEIKGDNNNVAIRVKYM